jgi:hypothetical protein
MNKWKISKPNKRKMQSISIEKLLIFFNFVNITFDMSKEATIELSL